MVIIVHKFMTYLTYLWHIYGYFVAKDKMFSIDDGIWTEQIMSFNIDMIFLYVTDRKCFILN